jgi:predicted glycosyltransferase
MLYSHDALGLGHVRRSLSVARAVLGSRPDLATLLVTCSPLVDALPVAPGLDYIKLPSARKLDNLRYAPRSLPIAAEQLKALRSAVLCHAALQFGPDLLLVDKSPAGLMGELAQTLALLEERWPRPRIVLGLRDILDQPAAVIEEWRAAGTAELMERFYDEIWVYGDPDLFDVRTAYALPGPIADRVRFLGYLVAPVSEEERSAARRRFGAAADQPLALVTVGGGEDGEPLVRAYLRAVERGLLPRSLKSVVVPGPCMPPEARARLAADAPAEVLVEPFVSDLAPAIAAADVVVGMGGYNTVCELLAGRTPAVLVPRVHPRREQWVRVRRLEARGLVAGLEPDGLDPVRLAEAVSEALGRGRLRDGLPDCGGLAGVARAVDRLLADSRPSANGHPERRPQVAGGAA